MRKVHKLLCSFVILSSLYALRVSYKELSHEHTQKKIVKNMKKTVLKKIKPKIKKTVSFQKSEVLKQTPQYIEIFSKLNEEEIQREITLLEQELKDLDYALKLNRKELNTKEIKKYQADLHKRNILYFFLSEKILNKEFES